MRRGVRLHLRGYRLPTRRHVHQPVRELIGLPPTSRNGIGAMVRAFDFFDRVFGEGRYRRPSPGEWYPGAPGYVDDPDDAIPF